MTTIALTGLDAPTFAENAVNTPQIIDADVTVSSTGSLDGATLIVTGLFPEDRVSVQSGGLLSYNSGTGEVSYGGVVVGVASGGVGTDFTITFDADATDAAIEALIEHLTYANVSGAPTGVRDLRIVFGGPNAEAFAQRVGAGNPFDGIDIGNFSQQALADVDGDGDLDLLVGATDGLLRYWENTGSASAPTYIERTGGSSPFDGIDVDQHSSPDFADLDGDGDLDLIATERFGTVLYFENTGTVAAPTFVQRTGGDNPFNGFDVGDYVAPALADLDGDGDLDLVLGPTNGQFFYFENTGTTVAPAYVQRTGGDNPLDGFDVGFIAHPEFADFDGDGDLDLISGAQDGVTRYFENTGTALAPTYVERTGAANPFNGIDPGARTSPTLGDIDGDGDLDLLIGELGGTLFYYENVQGRLLTVTVTAQSTPTAGDDILTGTAGDDTLDGLAGDDTLSGGDGNDYLKGGEGADAMSGGLGDDVYVVDDAGDTTDETGGDGVDRVHTRISWTLATGIENLTLGNGGAIDGTGNGLDNLITGNASDNVLTGLAGEDSLFGGGGEDSLYGGDDNDTLDGGNNDDFLDGGAGVDDLSGGAGNDYLRGGDGADIMAGGAGDDFYAVENVGDAITEAANAGTDHVWSRVTWTLGANFEDLTLGAAAGAADGTGNDLNNAITGNYANNVLQGLLGDDTLDGGGGDDDLQGGGGRDTLVGGVGDDVLDGGGDNDKLTGGDGRDQIAGGDGADRVEGGDGADDLGGDAGADIVLGGGGHDVLRGGAGNDQLTGGDGRDRFVWSDGDVDGAIDRILDFSAAAGDRIDLSLIDADVNTGGDQAFSIVSRFTGTAGEMRLIYQAGSDRTQALLDVDGDGDADLTILVNGDVTGARVLTGSEAASLGGWVL